MKIDLLYQDRKATKYNSELVLYVYLLFLKNQIVQLHVRAVGSSCTHLYMIYQLLIGLKKLLTKLRLLTRPSLLTWTRDTICTSQTPNRVNILNWIHIYSESSCRFHPHQGFPLAKVSLVKKIWHYELSLCMAIYIVQDYCFTFICVLQSN